MVKFNIFRTETFDKEFDKLPKSEQKEINKFEKEISENPYVGKPLGFPFFREKKLNGRRVYFLIYKEKIIVLMVTISDKKNQQATINAIKKKLEQYHEIVKDKLEES